MEVIIKEFKDMDSQGLNQFEMKVPYQYLSDFIEFLEATEPSYEVLEKSTWYKKRRENGYKPTDNIKLTFSRAERFGYNVWK